MSALIISAVAITGCGANEKKESLLRAFFSMDTEADLVLSDNFNSSRLQELDNLYLEVGTLLSDLNSSLSVGDENSYVSKFNQAEAGSVIEIDITTYEILQTAQNVYSMTDGYYNPAVYYSVEAYGFLGTDYPDTADKLPSDRLTEGYRTLASHFGELELSKSDGRYYVKKPSATVVVDGVTYSMKIDLGGIGKGYALGQVNAIIDKYGFKYGYLNFGYSSILLKQHYSEKVYTVELLAPRTDVYGSSYLRCTAFDTALSSSGDDVQYYEIDGVRYCHIIDPMTGKPVQSGVMSATVIGGNPAESDALTTAIMAMGKERAVNFINENLSDRKVVFTYDNNGEYEIITNMADGEYEVLDENYVVVSRVEDGMIILGAGNVS